MTVSIRQHHGWYELRSPLPRLNARLTATEIP